MCRALPLSLNTSTALSLRIATAHGDRRHLEIIRTHHAGPPHPPARRERVQQAGCRAGCAAAQTGTVEERHPDGRVRLRCGEQVPGDCAPSKATADDRKAPARPCRARRPSLRPLTRRTLVCATQNTAEHAMDR